jgi:hypothetical protein
MILTGASSGFLECGAFPPLSFLHPAEKKEDKSGGKAPNFAAPPAVNVLTPTSAACRAGKKATVQFEVRAAGTHGGVVELYSERSRVMPGCFLIRFPAATQHKFKRLKIPDVAAHFRGEYVRVTGVVRRVSTLVGMRHAIEVDDLEQISVVGPPYTPTSAYRRRTLFGFSLLVNPELYSHRKESAALFAELERQIKEIVRVVPADRLAVLRKVPIWVEWQNQHTSAAQHHVSRGWLRGHGYNPDKAGAVEISSARKFVAWSRRDQPWMLLHELAHAYHFRVLGARHAATRAAYRQAMERKLYDWVAHVDGRKYRAYAATNEFEYFAELTEAYFGKNDFFPFTNADLKKHDPVGYKLMQDVWGKPRGEARDRSRRR